MVYTPISTKTGKNPEETSKKLLSYRQEEKYTMNGWAPEHNEVWQGSIISIPPHLWAVRGLRKSLEEALQQGPLGTPPYPQAVRGLWKGLEGALQQKLALFRIQCKDCTDIQIFPSLGQDQKNAERRKTSEVWFYLNDVTFGQTLCNNPCIGLTDRFQWANFCGHFLSRV